LFGRGANFDRLKKGISPESFPAACRKNSYGLNDFIFRRWDYCPKLLSFNSGIGFAFFAINHSSTAQ